MMKYENKMSSKLKNHFDITKLNCEYKNKHYDFQILNNKQELVKICLIPGTYFFGD